MSYFYTNGLDLFYTFVITVPSGQNDCWGPRKLRAKRTAALGGCDAMHARFGRAASAKKFCLHERASETLSRVGRGARTVLVRGVARVRAVATGRDARGGARSGGGCAQVRADVFARGPRIARVSGAGCAGLSLPFLASLRAQARKTAAPAAAARPSPAPAGARRPG